jgi:glycerol-3-phosphate dehydrogenase (NAD+)
MKISVVGSGNYGTAIARRLAINVKERNSSEYDQIINMYCYEEKFNDRNLSEIINTDHINHKYLPNIELPSNIVANPNLLAICDADLFIIVGNFISIL